MKLKISSLIKIFFRFRYPVALIEPAYFWLRSPKIIKWPLALRPISLFLYEVPFLRHAFFKVSVNERIVENAYALSKITGERLKILDFGTTSSWLSLQLASLGHEVFGVDLRPYEFNHPNINFIKGDIFKTDLPENYFDFILIVSTLEHVRTYEDGADADVIKLLAKYLKAGGKIIITAPYGKPVTLSSHRVYSKDRISKIIPESLFLGDIKYFKKTSDSVWLPSKEEDVAGADSSRTSNGVTCFVLSKK